LTFPNQGSAADWVETIQKLERSGGSRSNKRQLAVAYNNYAIELSDQGKWGAAEGNLRRALKLDPQNGRFKQNLATTYLNHAFASTKERKSNGSYLHSEGLKLAKKVLQYESDSSEAYILIGDIEYANQRLDLARVAWTKAKKLDPSSSDIKDRLDRLSNESSVEKSFDKAGSAYFDLRYQGNIHSSTAYDLRSVLMQARRDVGREFYYWPRHRIVVLIYSPENFAKVRRGPDWAAGVYDGKIRVPFSDSPSARESVKSTLVHEYTHALIHDLTGRSCPVWLNEGIAEYQEAKLRKGSLQKLRIAARIDQLIPLDQLDAAFRTNDVDKALLAYQQSYSLVTYLVERHQFFRVRRILEHLTAGETLDNAFKKEYFVSAEQLEKKWKKWLPSFVR
jgi:tetratricopeptide (TPR) repeat protein